MFKALPALDGPDMDCAMIGGTIAKVHRYGQGEKGGSLS